MSKSPWLKPRTESFITTITCKSEDEREKRIQDLSERGFEVVKRFSDESISRSWTNIRYFARLQKNEKIAVEQ